MSKCCSALLVLQLPSFFPDTTTQRKHDFMHHPKGFGDRWCSRFTTLATNGQKWSRTGGWEHCVDHEQLLNWILPMEQKGRQPTQWEVFLQWMGGAKSWQRRGGLGAFCWRCTKLQTSPSPPENLSISLGTNHSTPTHVARSHTAEMVSLLLFFSALCTNSSTQTRGD